MRRLLALFAAMAMIQPAAAEDAILDAAAGLDALERQLAATPDRSASEDLAFASVLFLRAIEAALQNRFETNMGIAEDLIDLPVLRLPFQPNPDPKPFEPHMVSALFSRLDSDLARVRAVLNRSNFGPTDAVRIDLAKLWFDVNGNRVRDAYEDVVDVVPNLFGPFDGLHIRRPKMIVRFDAADAEWMFAYTHLLSGFSDLVLAFDPTDVIAEIGISAAKMRDLRGADDPGRWSFFRGEETFIDGFATVYGALNRVPDKDWIQSAHRNLLAMIAHNREFWRLADAETDNDREWIPNRNQTAALGFPMPPQTSEVWQAVLADAEAVLTGKLLIPHWRIEPGAGINVAKMVENPPAVDIVTWVQGHGLLEYMERGPLADEGNLMRMEELFWGDAALFMVLLN